MKRILEDIGTVVGMKAWKILFRVVPVVALIWVLESWMAKENKPALAGVETFHQRYNASQFDELYDAAGTGFQSGSPRPDFLRFMQTVRQKLGLFTASTQVRSYTTWGPSGKTVALIYDSQFEKGKAKEVFTFLVLDSSANLHSYLINSPTLTGDSAPPGPGQSGNGNYPLQLADEPAESIKGR
jgi:hypothetical protein